MFFTTHLSSVDVEEDLGPASVKVIDSVKKIIGKPRNYGLTHEEKMEEERKILEEKVRDIYNIIIFLINDYFR